MAQTKDYIVNYQINVEATKGAQQVQNFAEAISKLYKAKHDIEPAMNNIKNMMTQVDRIFKTKDGKARKYAYTFSIDTKNSEAKLNRVKGLLGEIKELSKGIHLAINAGQTLQSGAIKSQVKKIVSAKALEKQNEEQKNLATKSVQNIRTAQKDITKSVGKINAALKHLERGREINIKTDVAKQRLNELLGLLGKVKGASVMSLGVNSAGAGHAGGIVPYAAQKPYFVSDKAYDKVQEKLYANQQLHNQKLTQQQQFHAQKEAEKAKINEAKKAERDRARLLNQQNAIRQKVLKEQQRKEQEQEKAKQKTALTAVRNAQRAGEINEGVYGSKRRAAINRLQYSKAPTWRNMPGAYMLNGYMAMSLMKGELQKAVEYANIMESARSILKVADTDLSSFEGRFDKMAKYVRKIGVETKFTAVEVAGAVKYLSMAGMDISTITESIRPITNLALIGDNDVSYIADLTTNIMAGYDIKSTSMNSVADILASTVSRSNVNVVEMAESFKMAAGYLKMAGVDFTESAAAIGILGNAGIKGTMAGTTLRAMSTRFAKPTKEAQKVLDRLGVNFTEKVDVYGKEVERLKPLATIFEDLKTKGASMADMQAIFGRIGGNGAMMLLKNYDKLKELTAQNKASQGISSELGKVKQETTKGLWYQVTSQLSESFMQGYEIIEPQIQNLLKNFLAKFSEKDFGRGLASIGSALLDLLSMLGSIATWFTRNFSWIEPLIFSGFVATKLFKLAGAVTNLGVALGFLGKQSAAGVGIQAISGLMPLLGGKMSFANKRQLVTALGAAGVSGRGAMMNAVSGGMRGGAASALTRGAASGLFASQVATGNGLIGASSSIAALGTGAVVAAGAITGLVGLLGWVAYKTWKIKEAKDAVLEDLQKKEQYNYPSIDALYESLNKTYKKALDTKKMVDEVTNEKNVQEESGQKVGAFTKNWWTAFLSNIGRGEPHVYHNPDMFYDFDKAKQDDMTSALNIIARKDGAGRIASAWADIGKLTSAVEVGAFIQNIPSKYGQSEATLDTSLWTMGRDGKPIYKKQVKDLPASEAVKTYEYFRYQNEEIVPKIQLAAEIYGKAIGSFEGAKSFMEASGGGFKFDMLENEGFYRNEQGFWVQKALGKDATDEERTNQLASFQRVHDLLVKFGSSMRLTLGGSAEAAENILKAAGFTSRLYSNEPDSNDPQPFNANPITTGGLGDDGGAGGNYSGTGKLSSAAPKQVIVNITNLMSVDTIDLMKSPEGQQGEIQNFKQQMAQALIDVVHDFDATW